MRCVMNHMREEQASEMLIQNESDYSPLDPVVVEGFKNDMKHFHLLPPEILGRILSHLPQNELVQNRSICSYWRDTIDEHCPMKVIFRQNNKFLDRKLQLRIRNCEIFGFPEDSTDISFNYPQTIRKLEISTFLNENLLRHLINQVKPYVHSLEIETINFRNNFFTPPNIFPQLRELKIEQNYYFSPISTPFTFNILFSHKMPLLKTLSVRSYQPNLLLTNQLYSAFFNFLYVHAQSITRLDLDIQLVTKNMSEASGLSEIFKIPTQVESRIHKKLQLDRLSLSLPKRLIPVWDSIIKRQKNLIDFRVMTEYFQRSCLNEGIPFFEILSKIQPNFATLSKLLFSDISSLSLDGTSWVPLDCSAFREIVNLSELSLFKGPGPKPNYNEGALIINLGEIPLANLKKLNIHSFVCDSGELQTLVDNAPVLEEIHLNNTLAPSGSPRYASTGPHGGIIQKFVEKPTKIKIDINDINISNEEQNEKLDALRLLFPKSFFEIGDEHYFLHVFSVHR